MEADLVLVVATPELTCINDLRNALPALQKAAGSLERFEVVINKFDDDFGISQADILEGMRMKKFGFIPADKLATVSINLQTPVVLDRKISALADGVMTIAAQLYPPLELVWQKRGGKIGREYRRATERRDAGWGAKLLHGLVARGD